MTDTHGERAACAECGGAIEYVEYSLATGTGTVEVLDAWWAHKVHPADEHDAVELGTYLAPVDHERKFCAALDVLAAAPPRPPRWWRR